MRKGKKVLMSDPNPLIIMCSHFSTGGMPSIVAAECAARPETPIHLFIHEYAGLNVHLDIVRMLPNVRLYQYYNNPEVDDPKMLGEILELKPAFVIQHGSKKFRTELRAKGIHTLNIVHSRFFARDLFGVPEADRFLVVAPSLENNMREIGIKNPISVISPPIDTERFNPENFDRDGLRSKYGFKPDDFLILNVGLWTPSKNQLGAIAIFKEFGSPNRKSDIMPFPINSHLLLVGPMANNFKDYWNPIIKRERPITLYKGNENLHVYGQRADVAEFYAMADIYIHPSHIEACCVSIREAASMGLPCLINDIPENRDIFPETLFHYSTTKGNSVTFVAKLHEAYNSLETFKRPSIRSWVEQTYGMRRYLNEINIIYKNMANIAPLRSQVTRGETAPPVKEEHHNHNLQIERNMSPVDRDTPDYPYTLDYSAGGVRLEIMADLNVRSIALRVLSPEDNESGSYWYSDLSIDKAGSYFIHYYGKPWFVPYFSQIIVNGLVIGQETFNPMRKPTLIKFDSKAIGDTIAWLPAVIAYQKRYKSPVTLMTFNNPILKGRLPEGITISETGKPIAQESFYANYAIGTYNDSKHKRPWRTISLPEIASDMLGVDKLEPLRLDVPGTPSSEGPYICISEFASTKAKQWNRAGGWQKLVDSLQAIGYRVCVISLEPTSLERVTNWTGGQSLEDRLIQLKNARAFIGLSSGLAWLANAVGTHVFMINTCTADWNEFQDNVTHISRTDVCRSCWNDPKYPLERHNSWCPSGLDFQCSRQLSPEYVFDVVSDALPNSEGENDDFFAGLQMKERQAFDLKISKQLSQWWEGRGTIGDLGAGLGMYIDFFKQEGYKTTGLDNIKNIGDLTDGIVAYSDLTNPPDLYGQQFDHVLCLEIAEHIPVDLEKKFFQTLTGTAICDIVLSWAVPGQGGAFHMNERPNIYVIERMEDYGWNLDKVKTTKLRDLTDSHWLKKSLMVFERVAHLYIEKENADEIQNG